MTLSLKRFNAEDVQFAETFAAFAHAKREVEADVVTAVQGIIADVRKRGDAAVAEYSLQFDKIVLKPETMTVSADEIEAAVESVSVETRAALKLAADRIRVFHKRQVPKGDQFTDEVGVGLGSRWTAIAAVGLYVPGGRAAYPSSLLMNAVPAQVAGVERIVMVVPAPQGYLNPVILAAAHEAGVSEIYKIGGAQAVAALAFGTQTIKPVDKIVGPGNMFVAEAKRQVFGVVGIDLIAGPSEIVVVADGQNDPNWIAADLLSQAEHDEAAQSILITDDAAFAARVEKAIEAELETLSRADIARASLAANGAVIVVKSLQDAPALVDALAPEHVELAVANPEALSAQIRHAGAIFLGRMTPEAIGDYVAGTNHVLPTARSARFASGLSVLDFMKRTSLVYCSPEGFEAIAGAAIHLAESEGLGAHARSVSIRTNKA